jgi:hypothetical protein
MGGQIMKKQSALLKKAVFGLLVTLGSQAFAKDHVVTLETLQKNKIDKQSIQDLIDVKILLLTQIEGRYILNDKKVDAIVEICEDKELKEFVLWLKSIVEDDSDVSTQKPGGMVITSQDGGVFK